MNDFYVYSHSRADDGKVFYIGKGRGRRAYYKHGRSKYWNRIVAKHGFVSTILASGLTEDEAFQKERELIACHDGLCNLTDGGEGMSGYKHTDQTRQALSAVHKGRKQDPSIVEARTAKLRGQKRTPEQLENFNGMRGKTHSEETKAKMAASHAGRKHSQESIDKVAAKHRGMKRSEDSKARMSGASTVKRKVRCLDNGDLHDSLEAAAAWMQGNGYPKANRTGIWFSAAGKREKSYGLRWEYA